MKLKFFLSLLLLFILGSYFAKQTFFYKSSFVQKAADLITDSRKDRDSIFSKKLHEASDFLRKNPSYNQELVILIDFKIPSQQYRFFVHNLKQQKTLSKALVAHGSGSSTNRVDSLVFSNIPNSYQSSLGKYKIGKAYVGNFGKSYRLHGLDKTNNKAYERAIVLHPYGCVPDEEQETPICESLGCTMVSESFMKTLYMYIDASKAPILLICYYE